MNVKYLKKKLPRPHTKIMWEMVNKVDFCREHGMKRMGNHGGSIGSQHQIQGGLGQSQIIGSGSGQNLMSESYQQGSALIFPPHLSNL